MKPRWSEDEQSHRKNRTQIRPQTAARPRLPERKIRLKVFHLSTRVLQQPYHSGLLEKKRMKQRQTKNRPKRKPARSLHVGQEVVLINDGCHGHVLGGTAAFDADYAALAAHPDAFRQRDLGRQGEREVDRGAGLDGGIDIEADSTRADVSSLRRVLLLTFAVTDAYGQAKREPPRGPLIIITIILVLVLLRLGHGTLQKQVFRFSKTYRKLPVSMAIGGTPVK